MSHGAPGNGTIVAIATPHGKGAIGIVRLSGPDSHKIAGKITGKTLVFRQATYCPFLDGDGCVLDNGIALYFKGPQSYTGEDVVELHAHGSPLVLQALVAHARKLGARQARPGEFTERAFLNDKLDLLQAESVADLIESNSLQAAKNASLSLQGRFSSDVNEALTGIINLRVFVEGALDFPDEEMDFLGDGKLTEMLEASIGLISALLERSKQGKKLREDKRVVIAGRPNVGKSSLMNQLSGYSAAIVNENSGTTRDLIEQEMIVSGVTAQVIDTAGLRETADPVEREGVARAREALASADVIIYVSEYGGRQEAAEEVFDMPEGADLILVFNKIDLSQRKQEIRKGQWPEIFLSAKTGAGMDLLVEQIKQGLTSLDPSENLFLARERHIDAMKRTLQCLARGAQQLKKSGAGELLADDLREAQESFSVLTGEFLPDDLLGEIFSRFCIGK